MIIGMKKICRLCGNLFDLEEFHKKKGSKDGHRNECKNCANEIAEKYRNVEGFKEKRKEYDKNRYDENSEEICKNKKEYRERNKEKLKENRKEHRLKNREVMNEKMKEYSKTQRYNV
jgi:hypothetical protein